MALRLPVVTCGVHLAPTHTEIPLNAPHLSACHTAGIEELRDLYIERVGKPFWDGDGRVL